MKDNIWIWNSMARRRRSASDNFEENGIQILKTFLKANNISVKIIDYTTQDGYNSLTPRWLSRFNLLLYRQLLNSNKPKIKKIIPAILTSISQKLLNAIQHRRMVKKLTVLAKKVAKANLQVFGIKVWYGEAFTYSKLLTKLIHKYSPQTIVIAGGYHATLYEEDILINSNFDLAVAGNGEDPLLAILNLVNSDFDSNFVKNHFLNQLALNQQLKPVSGLIFRLNGEVCVNKRDLHRTIQDNIPLYPINNGKTKVHILLESTGCPWNACNFCVHNKIVPIYHNRQVCSIINELKAIIKQGIGLFRFAGSDTPPQYGKQIAKAILEANLKVEFTMGCRAVKNCKDPSIYENTKQAFALMIKAGLRGIFMGAETGNDLINSEIMNKGICGEDIIYTIKAFRAAEEKVNQKSTVSLAFIYPTPLSGSVTLDEVFQDNLKLIKDAQPDSVMITPPGPFKNTNWFCETEKYGFDIAPDIIPRIMEYEYVLYKPLDMWEEVPFSLKGMSFKEMLTESQRLRKHIEMELQIPTDLSDEHFLMILSSGMMSKEGIKEFKQETLLSIVSSDYRYLDQLSDKINGYSAQLAESNISL